MTLEQTVTNSILKFGEHLQTRFEAALENPIPYMVDTIQLILYGCSTMLAEVMQQKTSPSWLTGHLSDLTFSGQLTALAYIAFGHKKVGRIAGTILTPLALTMHEYWPILSPKENLFDYQDIACYWVAALTAYGISSLGASKRAKQLFADKL